MYALIMAGGAGSRLNLGEKPLISLNDRPILSYVIDAFAGAGCRPFVAASVRTPMTLNWCRAHGIDCCRTEGAGYIDDMVSAVGMLEEKGPLFVSVSDIPGITPGIIRTISEAYSSGNKDAASAWIPATLVRSCREGMPYRETIHGIQACPAGVNILRGDIITRCQDELAILLHEPRLALNVNTREDLAEAEVFFKRSISPPG